MLSSVNCVATNTDCWMARQHSYMGKLLDRAGLCRRLVNTWKPLRCCRAFGVLAAALQEIREKMSRQSLKLRKGFCLYDKSADNAVAILADDTGHGYQLTRHHNCACHLLYPLSTTEGIAAEFDMTYMSTVCETHRKWSRSAFGECQALCGKKKTPASPPQRVRQGRVADSSSEVEELDNYFPW